MTEHRIDINANTMLKSFFKTYTKGMTAQAANERNNSTNPAESSTISPKLIRSVGRNTEKKERADKISIY